MRKLMLVLLVGLFAITGCAEEEAGQAISQETTVEENSEEVTELEEEPEVEEVEEIEAQYYIEEDASVVPLTDEANENVVLLTIDDAPSTYTLEMAETLKELDAGAIFFVNGHFLDTPEEEAMLKELHEMGFIIGNHTYNHPLLTDISEEEQKEEIISLSDRVEEIIGERPSFFRAPNGMNTDFTKELVAEEGMVLMNWTYGYDYFEPYMDKVKLTEAMITGEAPEVDVPYSLLKPGANLLMHDREWTNEALADIINGLRESGYEIVDPHQIEVLEAE